MLPVGAAGDAVTQLAVWVKVRIKMQNYNNALSAILIGVRYIFRARVWYDIYRGGGCCVKTPIRD